MTASYLRFDERRVLQRLGKQGKPTTQCGRTLSRQRRRLVSPDSGDEFARGRLVLRIISRKPLFQRGFFDADAVEQRGDAEERGANESADAAEAHGNREHEQQPAQVGRVADAAIDAGGHEAMALCGLHVGAKVPA